MKLKMKTFKINEYTHHDYDISAGLRNFIGQARGGSLVNVIINGVVTPRSSEDIKLSTKFRDAYKVNWVWTL